MNSSRVSIPLSVKQDKWFGEYSIMKIKLEYMINRKIKESGKMLTFNWHDYSS